MTDFSKVLEQAKNMQNKMKETQESIKKIEVEGVSGGGSIKVCLNGDGELIKLYISPEMMKENKEILEDLIVYQRGIDIDDEKLEVEGDFGFEYDNVQIKVPYKIGDKL